MALDPEELGEGEVGQGRVGDEVDETAEADRLGKPVALGLRALVAPDEGGAKDVAGLVEHDATVHLAGEADGFDGGGVGAALFENAADGELGGAPPVVGILLGPADVLGANGLVLAGHGRDDAAVMVDQDCSCSTGADIDPQKHLRAVSSL